MRRRVLLATRAGVAAALLSAAALAGYAVSGTGHPGARLASDSSVLTAPQLHVSGSRLVSGRGQRVVLHGVDRSGGEFACVQGWGIWDGPVNQAAVSSMKTWNVNAVRVPLNEACWNGQGYVKAAYRGATYRSAVEAYVRLLNRNGLDVILDLHWTDGTYSGAASGCATEATCQKPMPDAAQAIPFWRSVAKTFKGNNAVIFDLFNEPFPEAVAGETEASAWSCWRNGGTCAGLDYRVAGMQDLVHAVRSTGARNVLMLGGLAWSNDLTGWLKNRPVDPDRNTVASWHSYNFNTCAPKSCWNSQVAPVIRKVPVIVGEMGENNCSDSYIDPLMRWLDTRHTSYLAWTWNADFNCSSGPSLITNYNGTPTAFGQGYRAHVRRLH
jgi:endoglucanase